jgi:hypothetical protein
MVGLKLLQISRVAIVARWIPAFAGMTLKISGVQNGSDHHCQGPDCSFNPEMISRWKLQIAVSLAKKPPAITTSGCTLAVTADY